MAAKEQISVSVTPALARYVRGQVSSGLYADASDLFREAVQALQQRSAAPSRTELEDVTLNPKEQAAARLAVRRGLEDIRRGRYRALDEAGLRR